jgi:hypothetical protein
MASAHGGVMVDEIYDAFSGAASEKTDEQGPPRVCARPGCPEPASGTCRMKIDRAWKDVPSRHCETHREELARIRRDLDADSKLMADNGGAPRKQSQKRQKSMPVCCRIGCWNPRVPGERFCDDCAAEGYTEDMYE